MAAPAEEARSRHGFAGALGRHRIHRCEPVVVEVVEIAVVGVVGVNVERAETELFQCHVLSVHPAQSAQAA